MDVAEKIKITKTLAANVGCSNDRALACLVVADFVPSKAEDLCRTEYVDGDIILAARMLDARTILKKYRPVGI